jgi:hypothetical protein
MKRQLWRISGGDPHIIARCPETTQRKFLLVGLWVSGIMLLTFASTFYAIEKLFHSTFADVSISLFFSFTLFNIYRFLLLTLTKNVLPHIRYGESAVSVVLRGLFLVFIAVIISKPIEVFVFQGQLKHDLIDYKNGYLVKSLGSIDDFYIPRIEEFEHQGDSHRALGLRSEKGLAESRTRNKIDQADFFVHQMRVVWSVAPLSILITLLTVLVFITPSYLKYRIPDSDPYYALKREAEMGIINQAYARFKQRYAELFSPFQTEEVVWVEKFLDPPYNTDPLVLRREVKSQEDFLSDLYGHA